MSQQRMMHDAICGIRSEAESLRLVEIGSSVDGRWPEAFQAYYHRAPQRQSPNGYGNWLSVQRQEYGAEPDDEEPE